MPAKNSDGEHVPSERKQGLAQSCVSQILFFCDGSDDNLRKQCLQNR